MHIYIEHILRRPEKTFFTHKKITTCLYRNESLYLYLKVCADSKKIYFNYNKSLFNLYRLKKVKGHIGRGYEWGKMPHYPKDAFYDLLQPVDGEEIIERNEAYYILEIKKTRAIKRKETIICSDGINQDHLVIELNRKEELLKKINFSLNLWQYPYTTARYHEVGFFSQEHIQLLEKHLKPYFDIGGSSITATIVDDPWHHQTFDPYPSMVKWIYSKEKGFQYDFAVLDKWLSFCYRQTDVQAVQLFSPLPWNHQIKYYDVDLEKECIMTLCPNEEKWRKIWFEFLKALGSFLQNHHYLDDAYLAIDERPQEELKSVLNLRDELNKQEGIYFKVHAALNYASFDMYFLNRFDDLSLQLCEVSKMSKELEAFLSCRKSKGFTTSLYSAVSDFPNSFLFSEPIETYWVIFYAYVLGFDGFMRWAYDAWVENPKEDASHWYWESGDTSLIYPDAQKSLRLIMLEMAYQDITKIDSLYIQRKQASLQRPQCSCNEYGARINEDEELITNLIADIK